MHAVFHKLLFAALLGSLLLISCNSQATPTLDVAEATNPADQPGETPALAEATTAPSEPTEDIQKSATILFTQPIDSFSPLRTNLYYSQITQQIWNCWAWDFDDQTAPRPLLVAEIPSQDNGGLSADGLTITMKLRPEIAWSDGTPITANDFVFTYQMFTSPNNTVASHAPYNDIANVSAPDERTVVITFSEPDVSWLYTLWHGLLPAHILEPVYTSAGTLDNAEWGQSPTVGCGPYMYAGWEDDGTLHFQANPDYWLGEANIDNLYIRFVEDNAAQINTLLAGDGDLGTLIAFADIQTLQAAGIQTVEVFSGWNEGWFFYLHPEKAHPALLDNRVRRAIAMALDRQKIIDQLLLGQTQLAVSYWDNTPYISPNLTPMPYNLAAANALLDEAGWVDSNGNGVRDNGVEELTLAYGTLTNQLRQDVQALAQLHLSEVGIQLELVHYENDIFFSGYNAGAPAAVGNLDIFQYSVKPAAFPDPDTDDFRCDQIPDIYNPDGVNWSGFCDQELESLFQLQAGQIDPAARQATFHQISQLIYDRVYFLGLWQDSDRWGLNPRLKNVRLSGVTPFFNILEWDIDG